MDWPSNSTSNLPSSNVRLVKGSSISTTPCLSVGTFQIVIILPFRYSRTTSDWALVGKYMGTIRERAQIVCDNSSDWVTLNWAKTGNPRSGTRDAKIDMAG